MRNICYSLLIVTSFFLFSCGPSAKEAIKYSDTIIYTNSQIQMKIASLVETYNQFVPKEMDAAYNSAMKETVDGIDFVTKLGPFGEDASFNEGAVKLFNVYKDVLQSEHKRIIDMLKLPESEYDDEEIEEFARLIESSHNKIDKATDELIQIQEKFSKKYKFKVESEE